MRLETLLLRELPRAVAAEAAPLCARALEEQDTQRRDVRSIPARRKLEHDTAPAFAALESTARGESTGWAKFLELCRTNRWLKARALAACRAAPDARGFLGLMHTQRAALRHAADYALVARLQIDEAGATLTRIAPSRRNATLATTWRPVIDFLLDRGVKPARVARLVAEFANVAPSTVRRDWLTGR